MTRVTLNVYLRRDIIAGELWLSARVRKRQVFYSGQTILFETNGGASFIRMEEVMYVRLYKLGVINAYARCPQKGVRALAALSAFPIYSTRSLEFRIYSVAKIFRSLYRRLCGSRLEIRRIL